MDGLKVLDQIWGAPMVPGYAEEMYFLFSSLAITPLNAALTPVK
jgi:hypothetical protein